MDTPQQALNKAKISLMSRDDSAFFTTVCFSLKHVWDNKVRTAATNGVEILFNPDFFMDLNTEEKVFLLLHETMHVALMHPLRIYGKDHPKWNIACDHVINLMLIERGFKMPANGLANPDYKGMSAEQVYALLPEPDKDTDVDILPGEGDPTEFSEAIADILVRAQIQSKMQNDKPGSIPGEIEIFLNGLLKPKLPWNRILQKYLHSLSKDDYSFRKPNRRFFPDHYLPSLYSEKIMDLTIAVDISGSVEEFQFKQFITELHSIFKMMKPSKIDLIQFDTKIQSITSIRSLHELSKVRFFGRGGTAIGPILDWVNENKPQLLMVFTDGDFYFRGATTKVDTIWLIHENKGFNAPFGKTIHYEIKE